MIDISNLIYKKQLIINNSTVNGLLQPEEYNDKYNSSSNKEKVSKMVEINKNKVVKRRNNK